MKGRLLLKETAITNIPANALADRAPRIKDHAALRRMARQAFAETFSKLYDEPAFSEFLDDTYSAGGRMDQDLIDPAIRWWATFDQDRPIGYAKLRPLRDAVRLADPSSPELRSVASGALELQQIYVLKQWHGTGVADRLMHWALGTVAAAGAPEVYLTVFDHNERAKRFYRRFAFEEVGRCTFTLGDRIDDDRIWRRTMNATPAPNRSA